jgi:hypothetical protein
MTEELSVAEVVEAFNSIDGIDAYTSDLPQHDVLVGVTDESQIGQFYKTVRELGVERTSTTRTSPLRYELDSWVEL